MLLPSALEPGWKDWAHWRQQFAFEHVSLEYTVPHHLAALLHPDAARRLFCGAELELDALRERERSHRVRGFPLATELRFLGSFRERDFLSHNVAALLRGRDPELADSYVLVTAHHDHLGIGPPREGDAVYNGVVDNALGVAGALELARVLASQPQPPRRSVLFLFLAAEEFGLLGSSYYVDHPLVPLYRTVADVNVDGLAHFARFRDVIGIGAELSSLGETLERVAASRACRSLGRCASAARTRCCGSRAAGARS